MLKQKHIALSSIILGSVLLSSWHCKTHDENSLFNLAAEDLQQGNIREALANYAEILAGNPSHIAALYNMGYTYKIAGYLDEAINVYKQVLSLSPTYDPAHLALGFAYLNKGDFIQGWEQHSRYLNRSNKNADALRELLGTQTIANKRILCSYEGGIGDTFMFIRYVELLKKMGAHTICMVQPAIVQLLQMCPYIDEIYPWTGGSKPLLFDASSTLMSLPAVFKSTENTIPKQIPYIFPDQELVRYWATKIERSEKLKIGLCWQSDVFNDSSRLPIARRGMPLAHWHSLLRSPNIQVYSLQRFDGTEQLSDIPKDCKLTIFDDLDTSRGSFMDSAALISQLDLVISIDSAIAHLAGALGKPIILILPYATDWRWIQGRVDSPWYPHMRIFKQPQPFDWESVIHCIHSYLHNYYGVIVKK